MYHMKIQMQKFLTHLLYVHVCTIYLFILMIHSYLENKKNWGGGGSGDDRLTAEVLLDLGAM